MLTWREKVESGRTYHIRFWTSKDDGTHDSEFIGDLTFEEAKEEFAKTKLTPDTPQMDIYREWEDGEERIACKDLWEDGEYIYPSEDL